MLHALDKKRGRVDVPGSPAHAERMLRHLAEHHGLLSWMLEDLIDEVWAGDDVSDLAPLLRDADAEYAARVLEGLHKEVSNKSPQVMR